MANERLYQFPSKSSPVPADIVFVGDSANGFNEVNCTIAQIISAYPNLSGIAGLTLGANTYPYSNNSAVLTAGSITALGVSLLADGSVSAMQSTLGYTASPAASLFAGWDANKNLSANNFLSGYATTVTAGATTTLVVGSAFQQFFTGSTTQTVLLPVTSTLVLGQSFYIVNNSSGAVTVQSSGGNNIQVMAGGTTLLVTCIAITGTTAASWNADYAISSAITLPLSLANGGTGAALTAANGAIPYSGASALALLAPGTSGQLFQSGGAGAPNWTTAVYPTTTTINQLLFSSAANTITGLATATTAVLTTAAGVPTWASQLSLALGGTNAALVASNGGIFYSTASAGAILAGTATANQLLLSGASSAPAWSTTTYPATNAINTMMYASSANVLGVITPVNNAVLISSAGGVPSWSTTLPSGLVVTGYAHSGANSDITSLTGLTGSIQAPTQIANSSGVPLLSFAYTASMVNGWTMLGNISGSESILGTSGSDTDIDGLILAKGAGTIFIQSGSGGIPLALNSLGVLFNYNFNLPSLSADRTLTLRDLSGTIAYLSDIPAGSPAALTKTDDTNVTLTLGGTPNTALLQAVSLTLGWTGLLSLARGGTNANLTASNGGILYSTASACAILAGTATAQQLLLSGASTTPQWSTTTYPLTNAVNTLLYASSANVMAALATGNNKFLTTDGSGVPSLSNPYLATTYTPVITLVGGAGNTTPIYTVNSGRYTNIGNRCFVDVTLEGDGGAEGAGTGVVNITLPIAASASIAANTNGRWIQIGSAVNGAVQYMLVGTIGASATTVSIRYWGAALSITSFTGNEQNNVTRNINLSFSYEV